MRRIHTRSTIWLVMYSWILFGAPSFSASAQTMYTLINTTNACLGATYKYFNPNMTSPATVVIAKFLTTARVCSTVTMNNAFCNPGVAANTLTLGASAFGTQVAMSPSCQWACVGCANVATNGGDGLPIELLEFRLE